MIYRRFGKTNKNISVFSLGLMRSMYSWQDSGFLDISLKSQNQSQSNLETLVHYALKQGINHLETARAYGTSERQLGCVLSNIPRKDFLLQTKIQPSSDIEQFLFEFNDSLTRLCLDRVDFLSIHGINDFRSLWQVCRKNGCLEAARKLQRQGKVGHVGFSGHAPTEVLLEAVRCCDFGGFDYLNLHWYTIFQRHKPVLEAAAERDMGVFIISPTDKGGLLQKPPEKLSSISKPYTPMQFNDLFCLGQAQVQTLSIGAVKSSDLNDHLEILPHVNTPLVQKVYFNWQQSMEKASGFTFPDAQWESFPSWEETPGYINIPFVLWLYNLVRGWGMVEFAQCRYQKLGKDMPWVPGNNAARVRDFDLRRIAKNAGYEHDDLLTMLEAAHGLLGTE